MAAPSSPGDAGQRPVAYSFVLAVCATLTYFALIVCAFGFISLLTDSDVVAQQDAGPLVGPAATAGAVLVVLGSLLAAARRYEASVRRAREQSIGDPVRVPLGRALSTGIFAWLAWALVGSLLYAVTADQLFAGLLFAADAFLRLYGVSVGILAALVYIAFALILAAGGAHPARPLWPWEK